MYYGKIKELEERLNKLESMLKSSTTPMVILDSEQMIGEIFFSANPLLESDGFAIRLLGERILSKFDYSKLYIIARDSGLMVEGSDSGSTFTIKNLDNNPYLRNNITNSSVNLVTQNIPDPNLTIVNETVDSSHIHSLSNAGKTVKVEPELGSFVIRERDGSYTDAFLPDSTHGDFYTTGGGTGWGFYNLTPSPDENYKNHMVLLDRQRDLTGNTDIINQTHTHTANVIINNPTYTSNSELRLNEVEFFMYIRAK